MSQNAEAAAEELKTGKPLDVYRYIDFISNDIVAEAVTESVTEKMAEPNLPVEIIAEGVVPTGTQVEAVAEIVTAGTDIV